MKKYITIIISMLLIIFSFSGCGSSKKSNSVSYNIGDTVTASDEILICPTKDDEDTLIKYINAKDEDSIKQMVYDGKVFSASKNDKLKIEDYSGLSTDVKIIEGDNEGKEGYVPSDTLEKLIK